ncbi:hypothetical protein L208DRAFT_1241989 [Tricholoma matsutake]|nr:hypothetical protein L208DRAFT_1241989 [Tricholoma matsutake 945]
MARGRPQKHIRNTAGLRNQATQSNIPQLPNAEPLINDVECSPSPHDSHEPINPSSLDRPEQALGLHIDSTRFLIGDDNAGMESDTEIEEASLCGDWEDEGLQESMFKLGLDDGDDMSDEDWLPYQLRKTKKLKTERPKQYVKGPDIMSKSKRTQHRYRKASRNQKTLDGFIFSMHKVVHAPRLPQSSAGHDVINSEAVTIRQESVEVEIPPVICEESVEAQIQPVICE